MSVLHYFLSSEQQGESGAACQLVLPPHLRMCGSSCCQHPRSVARDCSAIPACLTSGHTQCPPCLFYALRLLRVQGRSGCRPSAEVGIVLVHSFGGGAFAWRHVMQPLADACGLPVLAFDRPGFGEQGSWQLEDVQKRRSERSVCVVERRPAVRALQLVPALAWAGPSQQFA